MNDSPHYALRFLAVCLYQVPVVCSHFGLVAFCNIYLVRCWYLHIKHYMTAHMIDVAMFISSSPKSSTASNGVDSSRADSFLLSPARAARAANPTTFDTKSSTTPLVARHKFLRSDKFLAALCVCLSIVMVAPAVLGEWKLKAVAGVCPRRYPDNVLVAYGVIYFLTFLWFAYDLRGVLNGFKLKIELLVIGCSIVVMFVPWFLFLNIEVFSSWDVKIFPFSTLCALIGIVGGFFACTVRSVHTACLHV